VKQKAGAVACRCRLRGLLAVEIDFLHPDYGSNEDQAVVRSVDELNRLANSP